MTPQSGLAIGPHVGLVKRDVAQPLIESTALGDLQQRRALIDPHDRAFLTDQRRDLERDVAEAAAEIEDAHPFGDSSAR